MTCNHKWSMYEGFSEAYEHCAACGVKKSDLAQAIIETQNKIGEPVMYYSDQLKYSYITNTIKKTMKTMEEKLRQALNEAEATTGRKPEHIYLSFKDYADLEKDLSGFPGANYLVYDGVKVYGERYLAPNHFYITDGQHVILVKA